jgi:hypothetical protein
MNKQVIMDEVKFLRDQIITTFKGDSWHGPNLVNTLAGIEYQQAMAKPLGDRHTIWEITDHITFWIEAVWESLKNATSLNPDKNSDWPSMGASEKEWVQSVDRLKAAVNLMVDELATWKNEELERKVPEANYTFKQMLHGVVHHNLYHAGQIILLKQKIE